jgi:hypothetical protein
MDFYGLLLVGFAVLAVALEGHHSTFLSGSSTSAERTKAFPGFMAFRNNYVVVYSLMMGKMGGCKRRSTNS